MQKHILGNQQKPWQVCPKVQDGGKREKGWEYTMQNTADYDCAYCGETNTTFVDISGGSQQSYVEDCQVCCRPNILYVRIDEETLEIEIDSEYEG